MSRLACLLLLASLCLASPLPKASAQEAVTAATYACPMHAEVTSAAPGKCPRCSMKLVARKPGAKKTEKGERVEGGAQQQQQAGGENQDAAAEHPADTPSSPVRRPEGWEKMSAAQRLGAMEALAPTYELTCVMHPEVRQAQEGSCPKCGMGLMSVKPSVRGAYKMELVSVPTQPKAGERAQLKFFVLHPQTGARVKNFVVNHEKLFHLFVISEDLNEYQHIHPTLEADGAFAVETVLPRAASLYKVHADFFPAGGTPQVIHRDLATAGHGAKGMTKAATAPALVPDATLTKTLDGVKIILSMPPPSPSSPSSSSPNAPVAGVLVPLKFSLSDAKTGEPVRDLEPYLGAWGHTLILNADQSEYLHSHPTEMLPEETDRATLRGGPTVEFKTIFPTAGNYRVWTQFQRGGKVTTVSFTIKVLQSA